MSDTPIRLLAVAAVPEGREVIQISLLELKDQFEAESKNLEIVGVAYNKRSAIRQFNETQPDIVLVDLKLPGLRSIELISYITGTRPETKVLAITPGDPPYDRVILALQAGALGFVSGDGETAEIFKATRSVLEGETFLPRDDTMDVLQSAASDLIASKRELRARFLNALLGLIPVVGILAAFTSFLWREYWGKIGVRVSDLGVDASSRVAEFLISLLVLFGVFGPLLFIDTWSDMFADWLGNRPRLKSWSTRVRDFRILGLPAGGFLFHRWTVWVISATLVLAISIPLDISGGKILTIVIITATLLAHIAGLGDSLPEFLSLSRKRFREIVGVVSVLFVAFLTALSVEVFVSGPDLRHDGLHGFLAPKVLDLSARPAMFYDLEGTQAPLGALYLGGNADLYVMYDPNRKCVRMIPVGSTRVEIVDQVPVVSD